MTTNPSEIAELLGIAHHFGGGVYAKECILSKGTVAAQHDHPFDHLSVLAKGSVLVEVDGVETMYHGTHCILIEAGKVHKVTALEDSVWFCIHKTDETDPAKVDDVILQKRGE